MANKRAHRNCERIDDERLLKMLSAGPLTTAQISARTNLVNSRVLQRLKALPNVIGEPATGGKLTTWRLA